LKIYQKLLCIFGRHEFYCLGVDCINGELVFACNKCKMNLDRKCFHKGTFIFRGKKAIGISKRKDLDIERY